MKKKSNIFNKGWTWFKNTGYYESFRQIDKRIFYSALFDMAFIIALVLIFVLVNFFVNQIDFSALQNFGQTGSMEDFPGVKSTVWKLSLNLLLLYILVIAAWSFTRTWIYNQLYRKSFSWKTLGKISLISFISLTLFIAIYLLVAKIVTSEMLPFVILFMLALYSYKMNLFFIEFFRDGKFLLSFSRFFNLGLGNVRAWIDYGMFIFWIIFLFLLYGVSSQPVAWLLLILFLSLTIALYCWRGIYILSGMMLGFVTILICMVVLNIVLSSLNFTSNTATDDVISVLLMMLFIFGVAWLRNYLVMIASKYGKDA